MQQDIALEIIKKNFDLLKNPVRLVLFTREAGCELCPRALEFARSFKAQSGKIALEAYDVTMDRDKKEQYGVELVPALVVEGQSGRFVRFYGVPESLCLDVLMDCIVELSTGGMWFPDGVRSTLQRLERDVSIQVFIDTDCPLCPAVAKTATRLALESEHVFTDVVIASDFPDLMKKYGITKLPKTVFGGNLHKDGHVSEGEFLEFIFRAEGLKPGTGRHCLTCGKPSSDLICMECKIRIQAEAVEHKRKTEKAMQRS